MIAGPVAPRTLVGLDAILDRHLESLEHGLCTVAHAIELHEVASITALARDARGAPVLVFADDRGAPVPAAVRAARAHAHFLAQPWLLQRLFPHRLPAPAAACLRVIVVSFRCDDLALATLGALALPDLLVLELHEWSVAGQREWCARPVLVRPRREEVAFAAPSGAPDALAPIAREFMGWVERLDADVTAEGDRYARRVCARGQSLCTVLVDGGELWVALPAGQRLALATRDDAVAALDRVMAAFQDALRDGAPPPATALARARETVDLGDLRRSVAEVRVTRAECSALQSGESTT